MQNEKIVKKLLNGITKNYKKHIGLRYPNEVDNGANYNRAIRRFNKIIAAELHPIAARLIFTSLSSWYLDNGQNQIISKKDNATATEYFSNASAYGYLLLYLSKINFHCKKTVSYEYFLIDEANDYMGRCLLCGWGDEYSKIGEWLIESINYGSHKDEDGANVHQIIGVGQSDILVGWFLLDLYCLVYNKKYNEDNAYYPESLLIYQDVLDQWDTTDLTEVDKLVYKMADYHLEQTQEAKNDDEYFSFDDSNLWLFPYEILTWLKLRENKGLENPKKYSHPLMNTPVAEFFLSLKTPLEKPKDLPYAKELLEKFKTTLCPETEVPDWL